MNLIPLHLILSAISCRRLLFINILGNFHVLTLPLCLILNIYSSVYLHADTKIGAAFNQFSGTN